MALSNGEMTKVFILGATGHIGAAVVNCLLHRLPDVRVTALVRNCEKAQRLSKQFPGIRPVIGGFSDEDVIVAASHEAGIVINASPDLVDGSHKAIEAALRGLASRPNKGFYVQTSGAFLIGEDVNGERGTETVWDDMVDIQRIIDMPPESYHKCTDDLVRSCAAEVNVAIISPTVVYGLSATSEHPIPITLRDIIAGMVALSAGFTVSHGRNVLSYVHVDDIANMYVSLAEDAARGAKDCDGRLWGSQAYYFASDEEMTFADYMVALAKCLYERRAISTDKVRRVDVDNDGAEYEIVKRTAIVHGCGANVRCRSQRAKTLLGWKPSGPSIVQSLPHVLDTAFSATLRD